MNSMTGYAHRELNSESLQLSLEVKSWNNRYLDLSLNLPSFLSPLEPEYRERLKEVAERGKLEFSVKIRELEEDLEVIPDTRAASSYLTALQELSQLCGEGNRDLFGQLVGMEGVIKLVKNRNSERYREIIAPLLGELLSDFKKSRRDEGQKTKEDILGNLDILEQRLQAVSQRSGDLEEKLSANLRERFEQLTGGEYDENRILSELAVLLMKYGIAEELNRLKIHIDHFREMAEKSGSVGKKLDFLCQEMNREVNTIGSKNTMADISLHVVEMKNAVENIREQLRNVE